MSRPDISEENFIRKYEAYEAAAAGERFGSPTNLKELIAHVIECRYAIKRAELERLEAEAAQLIAKLKCNEKEQLLEELLCFKDVLALQRQLLDENDKP